VEQVGKRPVWRACRAATKEEQLGFGDIGGGCIDHGWSNACCAVVSDRLRMELCCYRFWRRDGGPQRRCQLHRILALSLQRWLRVLLGLVLVELSADSYAERRCHRHPIRTMRRRRATVSSGR
jgi:hypothetical protein